ncbi:MAG: TonB family protein [Roseibium sp.]|uniref:energy transducer TonB n=1 Tax=Roseibium sp. TaxID=1936156 RepID=UPI00262DD97C|nr:TonB family protein [Roseibium sp.]MCV0429593.1 TonB family protein [Roseibium sp.]
MFRKSLIVALVVSVAIHIAAVALTLKSKPDLEFEGGGDVQHTVLGESPFNMVAAGSIEQTARTEPVETEILQTPESVVSKPEYPIETVQTAKKVSAETVARTPVDTMKALQHVQPREPVQPVQTNVPILQPDSGQAIALPSNAKPIETALQVEPAPPVKTPASEVLEAAPRPVETNEAEAHPAPRLKPIPPKSVATAEPEKKVKAKTSKPLTQKRPTSQNSKSGSGGKSGRTAQAGGSQRKAKGKQAGNSDVTNYPAKVHRKLVRSVRKPRGNRTARKDVLVQFTIRKSGAVSDIRLVRSSGLKVFDQAVLKGVRRAAPFPPIPASAGRNSWTFTLPVAIR